ncbi:MAG: hydroxyacid dehydrogenase [Oscillospiraceae bacterium]
MERLQILVTMPQGEVFDTFWNEELLAQLSGIGEVHLNQTDAQYTQAGLCQAIKNIDICVTGWGCPVFTATVLAHANKLRFIAHTGGSVRPLVTDEAYNMGIRVASGNAVFAESVAEGTVAYALAALRKIPLYSKGMANGEWKGGGENRGLLGRSVGIVGYGMIARHVVEMLSPFRCHVKVCSRHILEEELARQSMESASMEEIFKSCDIVSLHSSMTAENYHIITESLMNTMKNGALLINTSRGAIIDEAALCRVLAKRQDITAVLDVYEEEPLPPQHVLRTLPNALLMPHMAGPTIDRRFAVTQSILQDIRHYLQGEKLNCEISYEYAQKMTVN